MATWHSHSIKASLHSLYHMWHNKHQHQNKHFTCATCARRWHGNGAQTTKLHKTQQHRARARALAREKGELALAREDLERATDAALSLRAPFPTFSSFLSAATSTALPSPLSYHKTSRARLPPRFHPRHFLPFLSSTLCLPTAHCRRAHYHFSPSPRLPTLSLSLLLALATRAGGILADWTGTVFGVWAGLTVMETVTVREGWRRQGRDRDRARRGGGSGMETNLAQTSHLRQKQCLGMGMGMGASSLWLACHPHSSSLTSCNHFYHDWPAPLSLLAFMCICCC